MDFHISEEYTERWRRFITELASVVGKTTEFNVMLTINESYKDHDTFRDQEIHGEKLEKVLPYIQGLRLVPFQQFVKTWLHSPDGPIGKRTITNLCKRATNY